MKSISDRHSALRIYTLLLLLPEQLVLIFLFDAFSRIRHANLQSAAKVYQLAGNADEPACRRELDGVRHKVDDDLQKSFSIRYNDLVIVWIAYLEINLFRLNFFEEDFSDKDSAVVIETEAEKERVSKLTR